MIKVHCFSSIRERLGITNHDLPCPDGQTTAADILAIIAGDKRADLPTPLLVAINLQHASLQTIVHDGDEVAFFPPVSGG